MPFFYALLPAAAAQCEGHSSLRKPTHKTRKTPHNLAAKVKGDIVD